MTDPARSPSDEDDAPLPPSSVVPGNDIPSGIPSSVVPGGVPNPHALGSGYAHPPVTSEPDIPMSVVPPSSVVPSSVMPPTPQAKPPAPQKPPASPAPAKTSPQKPTPAAAPRQEKASPPSPTAPAAKPSTPAATPKPNPSAPDATAKRSPLSPSPPSKPASSKAAPSKPTPPKTDSSREPAPFNPTESLANEEVDNGGVDLVQDEGDDALPKGFSLDLITMSPWMVSTLVHMLAVLLLALIIFPQAFRDDAGLSITANNNETYAETLGDQLLLDFSNADKTESLDEIPIIAESNFGEIVPDPFSAPPQLTPSDTGGETSVASSDIVSSSIGNALNGRQEGRAKQVLLGTYGGTATTEGSVNLGLEWLKRNQRSDGTWSLEGPYSEGARFENKVAATAMALLAFQGAGNTPTKGKFRDVVAKGWKALLAKQDKEGFFEQPDASVNHKLYAQAQATIALCELYGMTQDSRYREPAQLAVDFAQDIQAAEGGWRYQRREDSDMSVTGWFLMGLQSARMSGLQVKPETLKNVEKFLDTVQDQNGERYRYQPTTPQFTHVMTAEALLCRQYLGWSRTDERLLRGADYFRKGHPFYYDKNERNVYYWYYATQVLHHLGGKRWDEWNKAMRQELPENQLKNGKNAGSWDPEGDDRSNAGRLYVTCLSIYMLEVYYRHMPLYGLDTG